MLNNTRLTIVADSVLDHEDSTETTKLASYGAVLDPGNTDVSFTSRYIDKEACKIHRDIVRKDQAEFEDYIYDLQDRLKG